MADSTNANNMVPNRVIKSRPNTREERLKQQKAWKKKRRERERARNAVATPQLNGNADKSGNSADDVSDRKMKPSSPSPPKPASNLRRLIDTKQPPRQPKKASSRGALMLQMASGADINFVFTQPKPKPSRSNVSLPRGARPANERVVQLSKTDLKELNKYHLQYLSEHAVGSGSYGQCYRARYRGIEVIVKKMSNDHTAEGKERARRNLVHEAEVVSALGDHARLPMLLGIITRGESLCMVTQFHGVGNESLTLHRAAKGSFLAPENSVEIFQELSSALKHVHSMGYLHNDIKANNVVLEKTPTISEESYSPVLIDFGKSTKAAASFMTSRTSGRKRIAPEHSLKSYLAPEVIKERLYSAASDVYSLGKMLKAVSKMVGFYPRVRSLVKEATAERPSLRPSLDNFVVRLGAIKF